MKLKNIITATAVASTAILCGSCSSSDKTINILSYNVRNGIGIDGVTDLNRTIKIIRDVEPNVVCLQELDSVTTRSQGKYVLGVLADSLKMFPTFAPAINFDGGKYGIGVMSHAKPLRTKKVALPGREEERALLIAEYGHFVMACTHLSLTPEDQLASVEIITEEAKRWNKPFLLAGDFNATPDSDVIKGFTKHFTIISQTESPTYPSDKPDSLIDYIMVYNNRRATEIKVLDAYTIPGAVASDHLPQIISITID